MKTLLLILALTGTAFAQKLPVKHCSLTIEQSPEVRGLKLGQAVSTLNEILPRPHYLNGGSADEIGQIHETMTSSSVEDPTKLKGISLLRLAYLDDRLSSISIFYDSTVQWDSNLHFTSAIAEQLKLPPGGWGESVLGVRLTCSGFFVETRGERSLLIERVSFAEEVKKRKAALEQKKRVEFKP